MKKIFFLLLVLLSMWIISFTSCKKEISCEGCACKNKPPIVRAGLDQAITLPSDSVLLDGNNTNDPDGKISEWLWTKISGPASFNIIRQSDSISNVKALVTGTYQFELKVTDNCGLSAKDTVQVIVNDPSIPNRPPVANAGADQTITLPTNTINLDGSASSDPENNITSYTWTKISGPSSFNITNASAVQTQVTNLAQGAYQFELKVTDASGLFSKDTVQLTVNAQPTLANAGADMIITLPLDSAWINGGYTDATIPGHEWTLISGPSSSTISNIHAPATLVKNLIPGTYSFRLEVNSNGLLSADTMHVLVVDDPHEHNTITYRNLEWTMSDIYGSGSQSLSLNKPDWFDMTDYPIEVFVQPESTSQWIIVSPTQGPYVYECGFHCLYRFWIFGPGDLTWVGKKSSIKVKIL